MQRPNLFLQKGFDDTTTRAIALRAGVGLGTVFLYAPTKRDLLFLIINEELQAEVDRATGTGAGIAIFAG